MLTKTCKDTIQSPLVDLGDNLTGGEGRIKAVHIYGESGDDTGRLKSQVENPRVESEPIARTVVVPERIFVFQSFLCIREMWFRFYAILCCRGASTKLSEPTSPTGLLNRW